MVVKAAILAGLLAALVPAQPARKGGGQPVQPAELIKPGLYMIAGAGANSEVRVTDDGLIVVDGKLPGEKNYDDEMAQIKSVSSQPVKYLIVTHHHADHTGNNDRFEAAGVKVIGHENLKKNAETYNNNPKPAPPTETYSGSEHTLTLGGISVELHHFGRAHTSGDTVVYFPDLKTVVVSDVVTTGATGPLADYNGGGSFLEWPKVLDGILKLDFDTCIAGNGAPVTKADVEAYKTKIDTFVSRAKEAVAKGVSKDQLMDQIKTDDLGWKPRVPNAEAFYDELKK
jgi:glyoxylase-like metal-dependent hydrolase (beta-lactamase superfamily II)